MKKFLKVLIWVLVAIVAIAALFFAYLTIREYNPGPVVAAEVRGTASGERVPAGEDVTVVSWNVGYCGLGKECDFVMDGGGNAPVPDEAQVRRYIDGVNASLNEANADIYMLQEVDERSSRTYKIDERDYFTRGMDAIGYNYVCDFVPFPWPPIATIKSGVLTTTGYEIESADRHSLPCPFSWPLKIANLKRCLLVSRLPVEGSDKEFVVVNFHLEAYDSGEGKIAQTRQLMEFIQSEYEKGNYVIAGGDWNQVFPGSLDVYPNNHPDLWAVGTVEESMLPSGWALAYDLTTPTCRLLNQPYNPADTANTQYYVIDGFIVSPNVELKSVATLDKEFENSDHNPVKMVISLAQ